MKYTIISIDDSRAEKKANIRQTLHRHEEITDIHFVNGRDGNDLAEAMTQNPTVRPSHGWTPLLGEAGIWFSQMNCWKWAAENGDLLVLEDDAIVSAEFDSIMDKMMPEVPEDYDFFSLFVPDNQFEDFYRPVAYDVTGVPLNPMPSGVMRYIFDFGAEHVCYAYQGYSCVATLYSQAGAKKLLGIANEWGIYTPVDCFLFLQAHCGMVTGLAHKPTAPRPVTYDWDNSPTLVHNTDRMV